MTSLYMSELDRLDTLPEPSSAQPVQLRFRARMEWVRWLMDRGLTFVSAVQILERMGL